MGDEDLAKQIQGLILAGQQYHVQGRHDRALEQYRKAIALAAPLGDAGLMALLLWHAGTEYRDCDHYHHAAQLLGAALVMIPQQIQEPQVIALRAGIQKGLAITFTDIFGPQKPELLELLQQSCQQFRQLGQDGQVANVLQHIGGLYTALGRYAEADAALCEALTLARKAGDEQLEGWILDDMSDLEMERGDYAMALELAERARAKARTVGDREAEGDTWVTEARVRLRMGHLDEALVAAQTALDLYTENHNVRRCIRAHRAMAAVLTEMKQYDKAAEHLARALRLATRLDLYRDQAYVHLELAKVEQRRRNLGLAAQHAADARQLAAEQGWDDLLEQADEILRDCATKQEGKP